ncbi:MAG: deoxynucleoside kinase [Nanoarchaeota archaeon]
MGGLADLVIGIVGNIGSGKTTLSTAAMQEPFRSLLLSVLDENPRAAREVTSLREEVDPFLIKAFYEDPQRYALAAQINFLNARLRRERVVAQTPGIVLVDRPIAEDYNIFGKAQLILGNMTRGEFVVYEANYRIMTREVAPPDVYLYLRADLPFLQKRIRERGLPEEQGLVQNPEYLQTLQGLYEEFIKFQDDAPVIIVDANKIETQDNGRLDRDYIRAVLEYVVAEIRKRKVSPKIMPRLGKWLSCSPTEAVIDSIRLEDELKGHLQRHKMIITLAGNIALGKTALTRIFSHGLGIEGCYELSAESSGINDPLLSKFLQDKKTYCYDLQRHLLEKRVASRQNNGKSGQSVVEDRTPEEDPAIFHKLFLEQGLLTETEYDLLQCETRGAYRSLPQSDVMLVLQGRPELSWQRIRGRRRPEEVGGGWKMERDLRPLAKLYHDFPSTVRNYGLHKGAVLEIDVDKVDITNRVHQGFIYEEILSALKGRNL